MNCVGGGKDTLHKVAFAGVEDTTGLMFRTIKYFIDQAADVHPVFTADYDSDLLLNAKKNYDSLLVLKQVFEVKNLIYKALFKTHGCKNFPFKYLAPCPTIKEKLEFYSKGVVAIQDAIQLSESMDEQYKSLIGAVNYSTESKLYCICENTRTGKIEKKLISNSTECNLNPGQYWVCEVEELLVTHRKTKDSDGVVLTESAMALPDATNPPQTMIITSHMQMRNNSALQDALQIKLYEGGLPLDKYFKTDK